MSIRKDLHPTESNVYYHRYLDLIPPETELVKGLVDSGKQTEAFFADIPAEKYSYRYSEGKWSISEMIQHLIDAERVFAYRCLSIGRGDSTPLPGFEQDDWVEPSGADQKSKEELLEDYRISRANTVSIVKGISEKNLQNMGTASGNPVSSRACAFMMIGHELWHQQVLTDRYL